MKKSLLILSCLLLVSGAVYAYLLPDNIKHSNTLTSHIPTVSTVANAIACSSANDGKIAAFTDAANATDCTTGLGSTTNACICDGTNYVDLT